MKRWQILGLGVVSHQVYTADAQACSPVEEVLSALLPLADAQGVPLDAALITSTDWGLTTSTLRKVGTDHADGSFSDAGVDGGLPSIELSKVCYESQEGGSLCVAKPVVALEPETTYEWSAIKDKSVGRDPQYIRTTELRRFTTSREKYSASETTLDVQVLRHEAYSGGMCGWMLYANLGIVTRGLTSPIIVNVAGFTPSYGLDARVLTPYEPSVEFLLSTPPDCITLEAFEVTGARTERKSLCLEQELPLTTIEDSEPPMGTGEPQPDIPQPGLPVPTAPVSNTPEPDVPQPSATSATSATVDAPSNDASKDEPAPQEGVALDAVDETERSGCALGRLHSSRSASALVALAAAILFVRRKRADTITTW